MELCDDDRSEHDRFDPTDRECFSREQTQNIFGCIEQKVSSLNLLVLEFRG